MQQLLGARVGEKIELATIESQRVGQTSHDLVGWMTLAGFEMADVGRRGADFLCDLLLRQFTLTPAVADHLPKLCIQHRHGSLLWLPPKEALVYGSFSHPYPKHRFVKTPTALRCCDR